MIDKGRDGERYIVSALYMYPALLQIQKIQNGLLWGQLAPDTAEEQIHIQPVSDPAPDTVDTYISSKG